MFLHVIGAWRLSGLALDITWRAPDFFVTVEAKISYEVLEVWTVFGCFLDGDQNWNPSASPLR